MTMIEQRLRELAELPAAVPDDLVQRSWSVGRRQRRTRLRIGVGAAVLAAGATVSVFVAHPAFAETTGPGVTQAAPTAAYPAPSTLHPAQ